MTKRKRVTKNEFNDFINNYPKKLIKDTCGIYEPPLITYNDFTLGVWPDSIVASTALYDDDPKDCYYCPEEERIYTILILNIKN